MRRNKAIDDRRAGGGCDNNDDVTVDLWTTFITTLIRIHF